MRFSAEDSIAPALDATYRGWRDRSRMSDQEKRIQELEILFPTLSGVTFNAAMQQALASGQSVFQSEQGVIYEVFPDGTRRRVKNIEPPTTVEPGKKITIR